MLCLILFTLISNKFFLQILFGVRMVRGDDDKKNFQLWDSVRYDSGKFALLCFFFIIVFSSHSSAALQQRSSIRKHWPLHTSLHLLLLGCLIFANVDRSVFFAVNVFLCCFVLVLKWLCL